MLPAAPANLRRIGKVEALMPQLYLKSVPTGRFEETNTMLWAPNAGGFGPVGCPGCLVISFLRRRRAIRGSNITVFAHRNGYLSLGKCYWTLIFTQVPTLALAPQWVKPLH